MFVQASIAAPNPRAAFPLQSFDLGPPELRDIDVDELSIRSLRRHHEIREVAQLRGQIDLAAAVAADPLFVSREKKETSWAWSLLSSCTAA